MLAIKSIAASIIAAAAVVGAPAASAAFAPAPRAVVSCGNAEADYTGAAFSATDLTFELKEQGLARVTFTGSQPPITVDASWTLAQSDLADGDGVVGISYLISNVVPSTTIIGEPVCRLTSRVLEIHGSKFEQAGSNNLSMSAVVLARPALPS